MTDRQARKQAAATSPPGKAYATTRRWMRYKVEARVKVSLPGRDALFGQATDISQGGMAMFLPTVLQAGQPIQAELTLPYCTSTVLLLGVVRNRDGFRYGIEFSQVSNADKALIERVCRALSIVQ